MGGVSPHSEPNSCNEDASLGGLVILPCLGISIDSTAPQRKLAMRPALGVTRGVVI